MHIDVRYSSHFSLSSFAAKKPTPLIGFINELIYHDPYCGMLPEFLPLLQHLSSQRRWLLWLSPHQRLSKQWLQQTHLPIEKIIQLPHIKSSDRIRAMENALKSGNYSLVFGWLPKLEEEEKWGLKQAAEAGNTYGFIMTQSEFHLKNKGIYYREKESLRVYH